MSSKRFGIERSGNARQAKKAGGAQSSLSARPHCRQQCPLGFFRKPPFPVRRFRERRRSMSRGQMVILEDDDWVARLLETGLREHGYYIAIASEALEGVQRVSQLKPACIICDITLPDFDGYWVAQQVRSGAPDIAATPLLFLSQIDDD